MPLRTGTGLGYAASVRSLLWFVALLTLVDAASCQRKVLPAAARDAAVAVDVPAPPKVAAPPPRSVGFVDLCVGARHACALDGQGRVFCWGSGARGELGGPGKTDSVPAAGLSGPDRASRPQAVPGVSSAVQLRCGTSRTCVRTQAGDVLCWGDEDRWGSASAPAPDPMGPQPAVAMRGASDLWLSGGWVCAAVDGGVRCDGLLLDPQNHDLHDVLRFVAVPPALPVVCVLRRDGTPACAQGRPVPRSDQPRRLVPPRPKASREDVSVRKPTAGATAPDTYWPDQALSFRVSPLQHPPRVLDFAIWGGSPCFVTPAGLECSPPNGPTLQPTLQAALGGARVKRVLAVIGDVLCLQTDTDEARCATWMGSPLAAPAARLGPVRALALSDGHACALRTDGSAVCWGEAAHGQLGNGTHHQLTRPVRILRDAVELAGADDLSCARKADGSLWCWGALPHCDFDERCQRWVQPTRVATPAPSLAIELASPLSTRRLCSRDRDGWACLWGDWLRVPRLGAPVQSLRGGLRTPDGRTWDWAPSNPPARPVPHFFQQAGVRVRSLSSDGYCAIRDDHTVVCGHCGVCSAAEARAILSTVPAPQGVRDVSPFIDQGSQGGICLLTAQGTLQCVDLAQAPWQRAAWQRPLPVDALTRLQDVQAMAWGRDSLLRDAQFGCVLLGDGSVQCWGHNADGQLGDGSLTPRSMPMTVQGLPPAQAIAVGHNHACALSRTGDVYCWGSARRGAVGAGIPVSQSAPVPVAFP